MSVETKIFIGGVTVQKKLNPLLIATSFTSQQAKELGVGSELLAYYVSIGEITRLGHGVYRGKEAPEILNFRWEDLIFAMQKIKGGVICLISALALYELTEEIPRQHWIAIPNQTSIRTGSDIRIVRMRNMDLGRTEIQIEGITLQIFDRERCIIDSFRFLSKETAIKALKMALSKEIDVEKMLKYGKILRTNIQPFILTATT